MLGSFSSIPLENVAFDSTSKGQIFIDKDQKS